MPINGTVTPPPDPVEQVRFFADHDSKPRTDFNQGSSSKYRGRWALPPRIDPSAASESRPQAGWGRLMLTRSTHPSDRSFLQTGLLTPANSDGSHPTPSYPP